MARICDILDIFISSPSGVETERKGADEIIKKVSDNISEPLGLMLQCKTWEKQSPTAFPSRTPEGRTQSIQDAFDKMVDESNVFLLILHDRFGSQEEGHKESNTEREIEIALGKLRRDPRFIFLSYFRNRKPNPDPGSQEAQLIELQERLQKRGVFHKSYNKPADFRREFAHDLYHEALKYRFSTEKQKQLRKFWNFGRAAGDKDPKVAIVYPPVDRAHMQGEEDQIWFHRLAPHVVFEDFKAVEKVIETIRLVGTKDVHSIGVACAPPSLETYNRVWLCLPRNSKAQKQLRKYEKEVRFAFGQRKSSQEREFQWQSHPGKKKWITIQSPLHTFLRLQRENIKEEEWNSGHTMIIAKDFAVLSRFSAEQAEKGCLKDYFIAGLHGLGTWGAAWTLDWRLPILKQYMVPDEASIQVLLEITYIDGRITNVEDVSDKPASYFQNQNKLETIRAIIDGKTNPDLSGQIRAWRVG